MTAPKSTGCGGSRSPRAAIRHAGQSYPGADSFAGAGSDPPRCAAVQTTASAGESLNAKASIRDTEGANAAANTIAAANFANTMRARHFDMARKV